MNNINKLNNIYYLVNDYGVANRVNDVSDHKIEIIFDNDNNNMIKCNKLLNCFFNKWNIIGTKDINNLIIQKFLFYICPMEKYKNILYSIYDRKIKKYKIINNITLYNLAILQNHFTDINKINVKKCINNYSDNKNDYINFYNENVNKIYKKRIFITCTFPFKICTIKELNGVADYSSIRNFICHNIKNNIYCILELILRKQNEIYNYKKKTYDYNIMLNIFSFLITKKEIPYRQYFKY